MHPTPYPAVNAILATLLADVRAILGPRFVGMYLYGSLAGGDFDWYSDIDVLVVTDADITDDRFAALDVLHTRLAATDSPWAIQLEVSYMPQSALRRFDPAHILHPHLDRGPGERLHRMTHDSDWVVQRHILREQGIVVAGPAPHDLIDPVTPDDLRRAMRALVQMWYVPMLADATILQSRGYQSYAVLSLCRILYTLRFGAVVSKPVAARWAQETLGESWAALIARAWTGRQQNPALPAEPDDVSATLDFIRYTVERV